MRDVPRFPIETGFPILAGLLWLVTGASSGVFGFLLSVVPGSLLLAGGVVTLFLSGEERAPQLAANGGVVGVVLALPVAFSTGVWTAGLLLLLSAAGFVAAGWTSRRYAPSHVDVPDPQTTPLLAAKVALDEVNVSAILIARSSPLVREPHRLNEEVERVRDFFEQQGWLEKPAEYHVVPPPLEKHELRQVRARGLSFEQLSFEELSFESGYTPRAGEPGRERWLGYAANRTAHAWVLRHSDGPRPWLMCIHGFGMGVPLLDLWAFRAKLLHQRLGLNLVFPVLPLHGPRKVGRRSGDQFLGGVFLNTVHAEAQAMWDLRRVLGWVRGQQPPAVGLYGLSLGAYTAALLASLEPGFACVIAGVPATDLTALTRRLDSPYKLAQLEHAQFSWEHLNEVLRVVSPLALPPQVPQHGRYIFGGSVDRVIRPNQVWALWQHWERPRIVWYAGSHVSYHWQPEVKALIDEALVVSGLVPI